MTRLHAMAEPRKPSAHKYYSFDEAANTTFYPSINKFTITGHIGDTFEERRVQDQERRFKRHPPPKKPVYHKGRKQWATGSYANPPFSKLLVEPYTIGHNAMAGENFWDQQYHYLPRAPTPIEEVEMEPKLDLLAWSRKINGSPGFPQSSSRPFVPYVPDSINFNSEYRRNFAPKDPNIYFHDTSMNTTRRATQPGKHKSLSLPSSDYGLGAAIRQTSTEFVLANHIPSQKNPAPDSQNAKDAAILAHAESAKVDAQNATQKPSGPIVGIPSVPRPGSVAAGSDKVLITSTSALEPASTTTLETQTVVEVLNKNDDEATEAKPVEPVITENGEIIYEVENGRWFYSATDGKWVFYEYCSIFGDEAEEGNNPTEAANKEGLVLLQPVSDAADAPSGIYARLVAPEPKSLQQTNENEPTSWMNGSGVIVRKGQQQDYLLPAHIAILPATMTDRETPSNMLLEHRPTEGSWLPDSAIEELKEKFPDKLALLEPYCNGAQPTGTRLKRLHYPIPENVVKSALRGSAVSTNQWNNLGVELALSARDRINEDSNMAAIYGPFRQALFESAGHGDVGQSMVRRTHVDFFSQYDQEYEKTYGQLAKAREKAERDTQAQRSHSYRPKTSMGKSRLNHRNPARPMTSCSSRTDQKAFSFTTPLSKNHESRPKTSAVSSGSGLDFSQTAGSELQGGLADRLWTTVCGRGDPMDSYAHNFNQRAGPYARSLVNKGEPGARQWRNPGPRGALSGPS